MQARISELESVRASLEKDVSVAKGDISNQEEKAKQRVESLTQVTNA